MIAYVATDSTNGVVFVLLSFFCFAGDPVNASRFHFLLLLLNCIISATNSTVDIDTDV